jgi:hypothetical protein
MGAALFAPFDVTAQALRIAPLDKPVGTPGRATDVLLNNGYPALNALPPLSRAMSTKLATVTGRGNYGVVLVHRVFGARFHRYHPRLVLRITDKALLWRSITSA